MHAILKGQDEKLHWTEVADPTLREDDVLLEIHAAALNRADLLQREGNYPPPPLILPTKTFTIRLNITAFAERK